MPPAHVYVATAGTGLPPFVFVHGFACAHDDWRAQIAHFAPRRLTLACDLRGHGATPGAADECSIETFGADVAALLAERALSGALLVGHSLGCRVVLQAALEAPQRVGALVLVDGSDLGGGREPADAERATLAAIAAQGYCGFVERLFSDMFGVRTERSEAIVRRALTLPEAAGTALFARLARWDAERMALALASVRVPLMVVQSTYLNPDRKRVSLRPGDTTPWLDRVRQLAPVARIEIVSGAGHFPQIDAPERVNALLERLLS